jgi:hypothetical protein
MQQSLCLIYSYIERFHIICIISTRGYNRHYRSIAVCIEPHHRIVSEELFYDIL